ncbi:protein kinase [Trichocoleus sp. FACHB-90]|uniref:protein kinase domain-containing protein n=1 Tax=Cyanophyceae TaxID=3028117 RepID=UPI001681DD83|nr:type IV pilin-like G/H family protein [Trichocoleus sp. FACHB-90]MBD1928047.1 protein kinase [Trichocoleus sp. FACHB-90]
MLQTQQVLQGRYQLQQQLGQNAGRQTWLATDLSAEPNQEVIVKLLAFNPQMQWEELKLFEREAQVLKNLNHPKIPKYRDYFSLDEETGGGLPWFGLVQDYIPGKSLRQMLDERKNLTESLVQRIATEVLKILIYLHELSPPVLHRDIKPSNLIFGENRQVHLVDFGAVTDRAKTEGVTFTVVGTSGYAPPEQLWGRAVPASDLYALGATLIHLLTGTPPAEFPQHQMRIQFADKVNLNPSFTNWIEKLIEPAPEKRFTTAREALEAMVAATSPSSVKTNPQENENSVRYGRLAFLASIPLIILGLGVTAMPDLLDSSTKAKQSEAKQYVRAMNLAQQAYFLENNHFSNSVTELGVDISTQTENYQYSTWGPDKAAFNYGITRNRKLKSYVGGAFLVPANDVGAAKGEMRMVAIMCESKKSGISVIPNPIIINGQPACGVGTTEVGK